MNTSSNPEAFPALQGQLRIISAGAAQSLVLSLTELINQGASTPRLQLNASFGAVGAMVDLFEKERGQEGSTPCDLMISSQSILLSLGDRGWVQASTLQGLGLVSTGLARVSGDDSGIWRASGTGTGTGAGSESGSDPNAHLQQTLRQASQIYIPDPEKSTAGIHVKAVLERLGLWQACAPKLQSFPNGATAMAQMAKEACPGALGCTQKTEILATHGVQWVEPLPPDHALKTLYSVVRCQADDAAPRVGAQVALAQAFLQQLISPMHASLRAKSGFE